MRLVLLGLLLTLSCNDRTRTVPPVTFEPRSEDMGVDGTEDVGTPPMPDGICDDELDGASCELPQARGVCANERCVLTACESGFGDCTDAPGCETSFAELAACGGCGVACEDGQQCVQGPAGYVCAAGIVCPIDTFDLDSDEGNGCEWKAEWEAPFALAPVGLDVHASGWNDGPLVAGADGDARVSVALGVAPQVTIWPEPRADARALDVRLDDVAERVVWSDGVSLRLLADQSTHFLTPSCEPAAVDRTFVGASEGFVATQFEVFSVDLACPDGPCLTPVFGLADYQDAFSGGFTAEELALCDGCALGLEPECWGLEQCRASNYDATVCATCAPGTCPDLDIVDVVQIDEQLAIVTARGVLVFDPATRMVTRSEEVFDPTVAGGPRFVRGLQAPGWTTVLHSTGYARVLDDQLVATLPDLGLSFDPEAAVLAGQGDVLIAVFDDEAQLVVPRERSGRSVFLDQTTAPAIQGIHPVAATATSEGLRVFYQAAGQLFTRRIFSTQ